MPTVTSLSELDAIRDQVKAFISSNGETVTSLALKADVPRDFLSRFVNDSYKHSPSFEYVSRLVHACGKRIRIDD